jgi:hypothetical protein
MKDIFDIDPPATHVQKVENAVADLLKEKRQQERRKLFAWIMVPAFASLFGILIYKKNESTDHNELMADQDLLQEVQDTEELEMFANLDLLEDFETLEEWDGSEEA